MDVYKEKDNDKVNSNDVAAISNGDAAMDCSSGKKVDRKTTFIYLHVPEGCCFDRTDVIDFSYQDQEFD